MSQDLRYLLILSLSSSKSILLLTLLLQRLRGNGHPDAEKEHRLYILRALHAHKGWPDGIHGTWLPPITPTSDFSHNHHACFNEHLTL